MDESSRDFERVTLEVRRQMRDHGHVGSVLGYVLGWQVPEDRVVDEHIAARWLRLWERLGRPACEPRP